MTNLDELKCIACGSKGTLKSFTAATARKIFEDDIPTPTKGYRRLVCTKCFCEQSYWFGLEDILKKKEEFNRLLNKYNAINEKIDNYFVKASNEFISILKNAVSNMNYIIEDYEKYNQEYEALKAEFADGNISVNRYNEIKEMLPNIESMLETKERRYNNLKETISKLDNYTIEDRYKIEKILYPCITIEDETPKRKFNVFTSYEDIEGEAKRTNISFAMSFDKNHFSDRNFRYEKNDELPGLDKVKAQVYNSRMYSRVHSKNIILSEDDYKLALKYEAFILLEEFKDQWYRDCKSYVPFIKEYYDYDISKPVEDIKNILDSLNTSDLYSLIG